MSGLFNSSKLLVSGKKIPFKKVITAYYAVNNLLLIAGQCLLARVGPGVAQVGVAHVGVAYVWVAQLGLSFPRLLFHGSIIKIRVVS